MKYLVGCSECNVQSGFFNDRANAEKTLEYIKDANVHGSDECPGKFEIYGNEYI